MSETLKPETAEQVLDAVKWAAASESPLAVKGQGSKEGFGRAVEADCRLDLSGLTGIGCYEPNELFMTASAATTARIGTTRPTSGLYQRPVDDGTLLVSGFSVVTMSNLSQRPQKACNGTFKRPACLSRDRRGWRPLSSWHPRRPRCGRHRIRDPGLRRGPAATSCPLLWTTGRGGSPEGRRR